jgi:hypothetical protein
MQTTKLYALIASVQLIGRPPTLFLKEFRRRNLPNSSQPDVRETGFSFYDSEHATEWAIHSLNPRNILQTSEILPNVTMK